jgi:hypothetical protein
VGFSGENIVSGIEIPNPDKNQKYQKSDPKLWFFNGFQKRFIEQ